jgi:cytoskeleton protein RodZ
MQTIGERLEEARKSKGISIREAAEATKVRGDYLHKFESNQFDINLPEIYVRGFLRNYATYLALAPDKIVNDYNALGRGKPKTKPANREIYGRMDLTAGAVTKDTTREPSDSAETDPDSGQDENPATFQPSGGGRMPYLDKALVIRGLLAVAALIAVILVIVFAVKAFSSSDGEADSADTPADTEAVAASTDVIVHALDNVRIKMVDETTGEELFQGAISRGSSRAFPKSDSMLLTADPIQNVEVEINGERFPTGLTGRDRIRIQ